MIVFRVIYIGGIGAKTPKKLNNVIFKFIIHFATFSIYQELDRLFALRNKTVLISFGSVVVSQKLPLKVKQTVVEVNSTVFKNSNMNCDFRSSLAFLMLHSCGSMKSPRTNSPRFRSKKNKLILRRIIVGSIARNAKSSHAQMDSAKRYSRRSKIDSNAGMMQRSGVGKVNYYFFIFASQKICFQVFNKLNLFHADKLYAAVKDLLENDRCQARMHSKMIKIQAMSSDNNCLILLISNKKDTFQLSASSVAKFWNDSEEAIFCEGNTRQVSYSSMEFP